MMWDFLRPDQLRDQAAGPQNGTRVSMLWQGTVSFTRSGFVRVHWDDGTMSDEWATDLTVEEGP